jgi:hypothetical protein
VRRGQAGTTPSSAGFDVDLHGVADAQEQGAGVLHSPFHVGYGELSFGGEAIGGRVNMHRQVQLMIGAVDAKRPMQREF